MRTGRPRKPNMCELSDSDKLKLWEDYKPLIVVIGKQRIRGCRILDLGDLISEGFLGSIRAAELFDPDREVEFFTHVGHWIKEFMVRHIRDNKIGLHIPVHISKGVPKYKFVMRELGIKLGRKATIKEIAKEMNISLDRAKEIKRLVENPFQRFPMEEVLKNEATTKARKPRSLELESGEELNDFLERHLDPEAVEIIKLKFGLDGNDVLTCEQIAEKIKKSKPTILKIFRKSLQKLRKALED